MGREQNSRRFVRCRHEGVIPNDRLTQLNGTAIIQMAPLTGVLMQNGLKFLHNIKSRMDNQKLQSNVVKHICTAMKSLS